MSHDRFSSAALVDSSGFVKTVGDLRGSFSLLEFLDLCAILEGLVLHDRLFMVGTASPPLSLDFVKPLLEEGVVVPVSSNRKKDPGPRPDGVQQGGYVQRRTSSLQDAGRSVARSSELDSWYETGRLLGAEQELGCSPLALIRQRPYYEQASQARAKHTVCNLVGQYQRLSTALSALRERTRLSLDPYVIVPIPPLPLLILQLCRTYEEVIPRVLDIRDDYSRLRWSLRDLRMTLADPSVTPKSKLRATESWQRSWRTLDKYDARSAYLELANNALDLPNLDNALDGVGIDVVRLDKLLKVAVEGVVRAFHRWRVRLLHSVARKYLRTADSELNNQVYRLFGVRVTVEDLRRVDRWSRRASSGQVE